MVKGMRRKALAALSAVAAVLWLGAVDAAEQGFRKLKERDKCPVCGMFVSKYPDWVAEVVFKDGTYAAFDGPKDLYKYLLGMKHYAPGREDRDIGAVYVTDYYSLHPVNGRSAFYVTGSDVLGPMGRELVPFERETDAREFLKDHKGRKVLRFGEITADELKSLD
jgi:nitrous oxide reductase accessory protein NosL